MTTASPMQHSLSAGRIAVASFGDINYRLVLNNDLEDPLLPHFAVAK